MAVNDYLSMYSGQQMDDADTEVFNPDATPAEGSDNLVTSGGVFEAISGVASASSPAILNTASGAVCSFADGSASPMTSVVAEIVATQAGSGTPAPDNVRAISGYTGANVTRAGRQLFNKDTRTPNSYVAADGTIGSSTSFSLTDYIKVGGEKVTISGNGSWGSAPSVCFYDAGKNYISGTHPTTSPVTLDIPNGAVYMRSSLNTWSTAMIELGDTAHDYEPYAGEVFSVSWQDEAGTVYEGDAQIIGTGEGRKSDYFHTFDGTENWSYQSSSQIFTFGMAVQSNGRWQDILCSHFPAKNIYSGTANEGVGCWNAQFYLRWPSMFTDVATLKAFLAAQYAAGTPVQIKLVRATPETFSFNGVQITSLYGDNSLWNDVGGDTTADYRADTKKYIQSLLGA